MVNTSPAQLPRTSHAARAKAALLAACLLAGSMAGCSTKRSQEFSLDVAPTTGMLAVDVTNFNGNIELRAGSKGDAARVEAVARVSPSVPDEQAKAILEGINVDATLDETSARGVLRVTGSSLAADPATHSLDLWIFVPECDGARIDNRGGEVVVVGTTGATQITNRGGAIELRTNQPMTEPVTLTNVDGNIYYQVPATSSGAFDLETLEGTVRYRDRVASSDQMYATAKTHQARLNEGANPVMARTNRGDINVWVDKDPVALTRLIKKSFPDVRDLMFTKGSRRYTRNLPEDHPEVTGQRKPAVGYW